MSAIASGFDSRHSQISVLGRVKCRAHFVYAPRTRYAERLRICSLQPRFEGPSQDREDHRIHREERACRTFNNIITALVGWAYAERVSDCDRVERLVHDKLGEYRVNPNREFFRVSVRDAIRRYSKSQDRFGRMEAPRPTDTTTTTAQTQTTLQTNKHKRVYARRNDCVELL